MLERRIKASPGSLVFTNPHDGAPVSNLRYTLKRIEQQSGLRFTPHDLRRLAATSLERKGVPTYTVKAILNHATELKDVTGGYVVVDEDMKRAALDKLERFILSHRSRKDNVVKIAVGGNG